VRNTTLISIMLISLNLIWECNRERGMLQSYLLESNPEIFKLLIRHLNQKIVEFLKLRKTVIYLLILNQPIHLKSHNLVEDYPP
jgi:hypothetical protein